MQRGKKLYAAFMDLKKAYDRDVIRCVYDIWGR